MGTDAIRYKIKGERLPEFFRYMQEEGVSAEQLVFVCIGTDRSTGDALGPLVGTFLREAGYRRVIGTLDDPCDADQLERKLSTIADGQIALAIDACLGQPASVGLYQVANRPLAPGRSVGRRLPEVGHYSIAAIVNMSGSNQYRTLQSTSLHRVMTMANQIVSAIRSVYAP